MTYAVNCRSLCPRNLTLVLAAVVTALHHPVAAAEPSPAAIFLSSELATNDLLTALASRLSIEERTLQALLDLQARGCAPWLEVARQELLLKSLKAQRKSAQEFADFISELRDGSAQMLADDPSLVSDWQFALPTINGQIVAARAQARGDLQATRLLVKRHILRLSAIEQLNAITPDGPHHTNHAHQSLAEAQADADRLAAQHQHDLAAYQTLELCRGPVMDEQCGPIARSELQIQEIPSRLLRRSDFVHALLELREHRHLAAIREQTSAAQLSLFEELIRRLEVVNQKTKRAEAEITTARLAAQIQSAERNAAQESQTVLRLQELQLVALSVIRSNETVDQTLRIDSPTSSLPVLARGFETYLDGGQQSPLTAAAWQPIAPNWPINNWSATRPFVAHSLPLSGNANVRYSEPNYNDFYAYGNLRLDAPSIGNNFFRCGGLPWYLPGSTTNFK
jgi:hypothetical protein